MATTSFQKKARVKINQIAGTKPSLFNNQLLVSSGVPSLDNIIGKCLNKILLPLLVLFQLGVTNDNSNITQMRKRHSKIYRK